MSDTDTVCSTDSEDSYRHSSLASFHDDEASSFPVLTKMEVSGLRRRLRGGSRSTSASLGGSDNHQNDVMASVPFKHTIRGKTVQGLRNCTLELDEQGALDMARAIRRRGRAVFLLEVNFYCRFVFRESLTRGGKGRLPRALSSPFLITDCHSVSSLDLSHTMVGDAGAELIASLLPALCNIKVLKLRNCDIRNDGMRALGKGLSEVVFDTYIETVDLSWNSIGPSASEVLCRYLRVGGNLWEIDLEGLFTTEDIAIKILRALRTNGRLGVIEISKLCQAWQWDGKSMGRVLAQVIENNPFLSYLGLDGVLTLDNLEPIVDELCTVRPERTSHISNGLQFLDISRVYWSHNIDKNAPARFVDMLSRLVCNNKTLDGMAVRACKLETEPLFTEDFNYLSPKVVHPAVSLANSLRVNQTLTFLDLRFNEIGAAGVNALSDMLTSNDRIEDISIGSRSESCCCGGTYYDTSARAFRRRPYGPLVAPRAAIDRMKETLEWNRQDKLLKKAFGDCPRFLSDSFPDEMLPAELARITVCDGTDAKNGDDKDAVSAIYCFVRRKHPALMASLGNDAGTSSTHGKGRKRARSSASSGKRLSLHRMRRSKRLRESNVDGL